MCGVGTGFECRSGLQQPDVTAVSSSLRPHQALGLPVGLQGALWSSQNHHWARGAGWMGAQQQAAQDSQSSEYL